MNDRWANLEAHIDSLPWWVFAGLGVLVAVAVGLRIYATVLHERSVRARFPRRDDDWGRD